MTQQVLVVGGGIGGLAAALACTRAGAQVRLFEQATQFSEVGAGIQLGPNVVKLLQGWDLGQALANVAAFPPRLEVRHAGSGHALGVLRLGDRAVQRYGAAYATVHRADLHGLLLGALRQRSDASLTLRCQVEQVSQQPDAVTLQTREGLQVAGDLLVGADGVWSRVRELVLHDGAPRATGHLAYRAMVPQHSLPKRLRSQQVTVWLGPRLHVVQYPVRGGEWLNVVGIVEGQLPMTPDAPPVRNDAEHWDHSASVAELRAAMAQTCAPLQDLMQAIEGWRRWALCDRMPMQGPHEQAQGRVALLGDAAHPMLPYLAQGAGMAIEDAAELGQMLAQPGLDGVTAWRGYAQNRWQRNARVQARAIRNGRIFHASGPLRWGRDAAMKLLGERLLDVPWLYQGS
jgi:salicylate hydroxylase